MYWRVNNISLDHVRNIQYCYLWLSLFFVNWVLFRPPRKRTNDEFERSHSIVNDINMTDLLVLCIFFRVSKDYDFFGVQNMN